MFVQFTAEMGVETEDDRSPPCVRMGLSTGPASTTNENSSAMENATRAQQAIVLLVTLSLTNALRNIAPKQSKIFNVVDNEPLTQHDCYQWLARRFGRPMPSHSAISEKRKRGATNKRVSNARLQATGWEPKYPKFQDGIEQSVLPVFDLLGA